VLLAGGTVVISMLGLFGMGLSFMRGAALVTIAAIAIVLLSAITLIPALLGYFGAHIDRLRLPRLRRRSRKHGSGITAGTGWMRWSQLVQRHRFVAAAAGLGILLAVASPFLGVHFGFPDSGNSAEGSSTRTAYDLLADGFGPGVNGPLLITVSTPDDSLESPTGAAALADRVGAVLTSAPGVAAVSPAQLNPTADTAIIIVTPTTGPQDTRTEDLVRTLRTDLLPAAIAGSQAEVHVGGATAVSIDSTANISSRIPILIAAVVLLSMLLLLVSFRSIAVAVKAAVMNLLSVAAAYGAVALVLQGGWTGRLIGIDHPTPLAPFIPVLMFAVLFGLSMDYEVFLVARMRETWLATGSNTAAIVKGLAGTARVITAAAIMIAVFAAFIPSTDIAVKVIGIGMAAAILIDATVIRMLLVPAVMHLLGDRNWWLPARLDRALPEVHIEGHPQHYQPTSAPADADQAPAAAHLASV